MAFTPLPLGECLLALTKRGICFLAFVDGDRQAVLDQLKLDWANASFREDPSLTGSLVELIFASHRAASKTGREPTGISLHLRGTNFQIKVWEALLRLPLGSATSYEALADRSVRLTRPARSGTQSPAIRSPTSSPATACCRRQATLAIIVTGRHANRPSWAGNCRRWNGRTKGEEAVHLSMF